MKRIIIFLLAIALFALTACEEKTPDNVLSQEKMEEVIYELMRIDGACEQKYIMRGDTLNTRSTTLCLRKKALRSNSLTRRWFGTPIILTNSKR